MYQVTIGPAVFDSARKELIIYRNGQEIARHADYGEPEDNSFDRDWAWVKAALEYAYMCGRDDVRHQNSISGH